MASASGSHLHRGAGLGPLAGWSGTAKPTGPGPQLLALLQNAPWALLPLNCECFVEFRGHGCPNVVGVKKLGAALGDDFDLEGDGSHAA